MKQRVNAVWIIVVLSIVTGCASGDPPGSLAHRFFDTIKRYPATREPLRIAPLSSSSFNGIRNAGRPPDVYIVVHPAYALYFRDAKRTRYADVKYELLTRQFEEEERFLREAARSGKIVILIVPGEYETQSRHPGAYTAYLNAVTGNGASVFYVYSESVGNGSISTTEMVELYRFLQNLKAGRVLIGGGYIGRCQREFYNELTAYYETTGSYIVPEISTISPADISDQEAAAILQAIEHGDYTPVRNFIEKKLDRSPDILFAPA